MNRIPRGTGYLLKVVRRYPVPLGVLRFLLVSITLKSVSFQTYAVVRRTSGSTYLSGR